MIRFHRPAAPDWMTPDWCTRKVESFCASKRFSWGQVRNQKVNQLLCSVLSNASSGHSTYCDHFPLGPASRETIDHFRPKSKFMKLAYDWENLFLCCDRCQEKKGDNFSDQWLKPDESEYDFQYFFICDFDTGNLIPNPQREGVEQARAERVINDFGLNEYGRPRSRVLERTRYLRVCDDEDESLDSFSYRFYLM